MRKVIRDIDLQFVYPPIPDRNFDWRATRSGYDVGDLMGVGRTPVIALADLLEQEAEREPDFNTESNLHADTVAERFDSKQEARVFHTSTKEFFKRFLKL